MGAVYENYSKMTLIPFLGAYNTISERKGEMDLLNGLYTVVLSQKNAYQFVSNKIMLHLTALRKSWCISTVN